jgi:hypothetical protein
MNQSYDKKKAKGQFLLPKEKGIGEFAPKGNLVLFSHREKLT